MSLVFSLSFILSVSRTYKLSKSRSKYEFENKYGGNTFGHALKGWRDFEPFCAILNNFLTSA